jgi:hypothetical protein
MSGLTSIHFPASVTAIGESCFSGCGSLTSITFDPASTFGGGDPDLLAGVLLGDTDLGEATALFDDEGSVKPHVTSESHLFLHQFERGSL